MLAMFLASELRLGLKVGSLYVLRLSMRNVKRP